MAAVSTFDAFHMDPAKCEYGLINLLICREVLIKEMCPPPENRLKAMDPRHCASPVIVPLRNGAAVPETTLLEADNDDAQSYISEGEPAEPSELVAWGKSQRGAWWRVRPALREDLVVRAGVSLSSAEVRRAAPGEVFQQKGMPRVLLTGKAQGCIRMPIQPNGWVTADLSRAGGPQFVTRTHAPLWKAVYQAPGNGNAGQDIILRSAVELDSEAVGSLSCGDVVEQSGASVVRPGGIIRMPITVTGQNAVGTRLSGWVTVDASVAGGPVFFKHIPEGGSDVPGKGRRRGQNNS
eukprot:TRINITY_DN49047_c0_g1_i1.p1 TRINITY_DN49047_c0_g1~~TRINITY_DN49047_c0_g1_i1.p1  ORF type:complete len:294 (-),score=46.37 TRINITY_DN49047_c0_g1_i1:116-997(-)